jgi:uncharacterized membrane protein YbjE (DUF340 family)
VIPESGLPAEDKLLVLAQKVVEPLVKANQRRKWWLIAQSVAIVALVVVIVIGAFNTQRLNNLVGQVQRNATTAKTFATAEEQHACNALELLTATPIPNPGATAAKNPSREATYKFYEALIYWETADSCKKG